MLPREKCVGCAACEQVCPQKCITMRADPKGFLHPEIDATACINCGACEKVCHVMFPVLKYPLPQKVYAARTKEPGMLQRSSSGGIASMLAQDFVEKGGIVYGAAFDKNLVVQHIRVTDASGLQKIQGSKYVQSDFRAVYPLLKKDLTGGNRVLVFGTPCQIAGLRKFFGKKENLLLCDLICHRAPSPKLFAEHIKAIESEEKRW